MTERLRDRTNRIITDLYGRIRKRTPPRRIPLSVPFHSIFQESVLPDSGEQSKLPAGPEDQEWPEEKIRANNEMNKAFVRALDERKKYP